MLGKHAARDIFVAAIVEMKHRNPKFGCVRIGQQIAHAFGIDGLPSRPGELHPEPLTDPDVTLSRHPARATARRLPPSIVHRVPPVAG
jgi:hypothetical protein